MLTLTFLSFVTAALYISLLSSSFCFNEIIFRILMKVNHETELNQVMRNSQRIHENREMLRLKDLYLCIVYHRPCSHLGTAYTQIPLLRSGYKGPDRRT